MPGWAYNHPAIPSFHCPFLIDFKSAIMSRYDGQGGIDPAEPFVAAFHTWENAVRDRFRIDSDLANAYMDLLKRYSNKCAEFEREKRNATLWEKEQLMVERELNSLKAAAVRPGLPTTSSSTCKSAPVPGMTIIRPRVRANIFPGIFPFRLCCHRWRWSGFSRGPYCQRRRGRRICCPRAA